MKLWQNLWKDLLVNGKFHFWHVNHASLRISMAENQNCQQLSVLNIKFLEYVWNGLWATCKSSSTTLRTPGFIMDQNGWKSELHGNFQWRIPMSIFKKNFPAVQLLILVLRQTCTSRKSVLFYFAKNTQQNVPVKLGPWPCPYFSTNETQNFDLVICKGP
jgi:hypothetical protein